MAYIEQVEIVGFWGDRTLKIKLHEDVNFLIGPNGSGKTTVINTIAAALTGDFPTLDRLPFKSIKITLFDPQTRRKPSVKVAKEERARSPFPSIEYSIKESAQGRESHYSLDQYEEDRFFREHPAQRVRSKPIHRDIAADIIHRLNNLAPTSWLSIHRAAGPRNVREERGYEFTVDQKLDEITNSLVRFFSGLAKRSSDETLRFQETIFLSLIYEHKIDELFRASTELPFKEEQAALNEIFKKFNLPEENYLDKTKKHYRSAAKAARNMGKKEPTILNDLFILMNSWRIHSVIQEWNVLIEKQQEIFRPRDSFLDIMNSMFQRKTLFISETNELFAVTRSDKSLHPRELSSGEKQLLIILGEALLKRDTPCIYIADEPELSLHVNWQVVLIDNLRKMNPSGQIIVATHSPDIVSHFQERVLNMDRILS